MQQPSQKEYRSALAALRDGGIVAYPTETFYGLAVDPNNEKAIAALYALKQRDSNKPLSILIPEQSHLAKLSCHVPDVYETLIDSFWPGPLTLVFSIPEGLQQLSPLHGQGTIAIRISSHGVARQLCRLWGGPITATSANISGEQALVCAKDVKALWGTNIDYILDGGITTGGKGSTIVRFSQTRGELSVLREGVVKTGEIIKMLAAYDIICKA